MCADHGGVDERRCFINVDTKFPKHTHPDIFQRPVTEAVVDRLPVSESLWQIAPLDPRSRAEDHRVDEETITLRCFASLRSARKQRLKLSPLRIGQRVSLHHQV